MLSFDYVGRTRRVQQKAKAEGVDCTIIMRPANIRYLTGFWGYATRAEYFEPRRLIALIVLRDTTSPASTWTDSPPGSRTACS